MKIMTEMEVENVVSTFVSALPAVINTVQLVLNAQDEDSLQSLLEDLVNCARWRERGSNNAQRDLRLCSAAGGSDRGDVPGDR